MRDLIKCAWRGGQYRRVVYIRLASFYTRMFGLVVALITVLVGIVVAAVALLGRTVVGGARMLERLPGIYARGGRNRKSKSRPVPVADSAWPTGDALTASAVLQILKSHFIKISKSPTLEKASTDIIKIVKSPPIPFNTALSTIMPESPQLTYISVKAGGGTIHSGQRKLLIALLDALVDVPAAADVTVVYVGAAPGSNIELVAALFPATKFVLFDPNPFDEALIAAAAASGGRIRLRSQYFLDPDCAEFAEASAAGHRVVFISDIRGGIRGRAVDEVDTQLSNEIVEQDMRMQERWVRTIRPAVFSLKFRLPYVVEGVDPHRYPYLGGRVRIQSWPGPSSSETRLVGGEGDCDRTTNYDPTVYENQCFYHNFVTRVWNRYAIAIEVGRGGQPPHDMDDGTQPARRFELASAAGVAPAHGMCRCFDCANEADVWGRYWDRTDAVRFGLDRAAFIAAAVNVASTFRARDGFRIAKDGHGLHPNDPAPVAMPDIWRDSQRAYLRQDHRTGAQKYGATASQSVSDPDTLNVLNSITDKK
jgi:hypothetical protein